VQGSFMEGGELFQQYSWLRLPIDSQFCATAGADGGQIWLKSVR
jgi:hypothetical protein